MFPEGKGAGKKKVEQKKQFHLAGNINFQYQFRAIQAKKGDDGEDQQCCADRHDGF